MPEEQAVQLRTAGFINDTRGRKARQLDPVALHLLHRHDVIDAETLRQIAHEPGVAIAGKERAALIVAVVGLVAVACLFIYSLIERDFGDAPWARSASLLYFCGLPWLIWFVLKKVRFGKIAAAMLKYDRCPHCGYDLRLLPVDPSDGATVCPECGCAWKLDNTNSGQH